MKLLKTTLAVVAATAISSAVFADVSVQYQWAKSGAGAELTYNGQTLVSGQTIKEEIASGHIAVFKASAGMNITAISIPCVLSNNSIAETTDAADLVNQVVLTNSSISAKATADDASIQTFDSACAPTAVATTAVLSDTAQSLTFATPVDEVSYTVLSIDEYTGSPAVAGTYTGTVAVTVAAE